MADALAVRLRSGLQAHTDVTHFVRYAEAEAEAQLIDGERLRAFGRTIRVGAFPIGIDVDGFSQMATDDDGSTSTNRCATNTRAASCCSAWTARLLERLPQRVQAFREMLDRYPEMRQSATLIQIAAPSREDVDAYDQLRQEMDSLCGSVNGDYGELDWMPVRYIHRSLDRTSLPGLYRASRVALVTPLRDGMNLVAKEFIAAQDAKDRACWCSRASPAPPSS
ncbi:trehalose-6-phosphate synthase [Burkholderia glumae]|uniref:trehalose-6-phosphate synthase n=1 Tax=Burkholderia glumae TaxID=337 RepID=UPI0021510138|nr:trehalose-6-phosphate synthase [Burkholderia glumae]